MSGKIRFAQPTNLQNAHVHVALVETSLADAAARTIAEDEFEATGRNVSELGFQLTLPIDAPQRGLRFEVEIGVSKGRLRRGDYRNVVAVPWRGQTRDIVVAVRRI